MNTDPQRIVQPDIQRDATRWVIKSCIYIVVFGIDLFVPAGDLGWGMAWVYLGVYVLNQVILVMILPPELMAERAKRQEGSKTWDVVLATLAALLMPMLMYIVAGLDYGRGGATRMSVSIQIIALVVMVGGIALSTWAMTANKFFSALVRIQADRGHTVQTGGPYRYVRHPGYVGGILHHIAAPLMLGSWWALIPGSIGALLLVLRTALEDKTLQEELPGYVAYTQQTRYRLIPGIW